MIRPNSDVVVSEQLAIFLFIIGQKFTNKAVALFICRSVETISRYFHNFLSAVVTLEAEFLIQPNAQDHSDFIFRCSRFYPYFKVLILQKSLVLTSFLWNSITLVS